MTPNPLHITSDSRNGMLDGIRGIAILLVLAFKSFHTNLQDASAFEKWMLYVPVNGWLGVDLFFVLSGFLISGILLDARRQTFAAYLKDFYVKRAFRILPLYYLLCAIVFVVYPLATLGEATPFSKSGWYFLHLSNIYQAMGNEGGAMSIAWSLAIEEQFYFLWPIVVWCCSPKALVKVSLAAIALAVATRLHIANTNPGVALYFLTPCRMDALACGSLLAALARLDFGQRVAKWLRILLGCSFAAIVFLALKITGSHEFADYRTTFHPLMYTYGYTLYAIFFACAIGVALTSDSVVLRSLLSYRLLIGFGKYSYCIYLIHMFVFMATLALARTFADYGKYTALLIVFAVTSFLCFLLAELSWRHFEEPLVSLRRRFLSVHSNVQVCRLAAKSSSMAPETNVNHSGGA